MANRFIRKPRGRQASLKVIQVNANRSKTAQDLLEATARERRADMLLVCEPNNVRTESWLNDGPAGDVAIQIRGAARTQVTGWGSPAKGIVWTRVAGVLTYCCYFSPNRTPNEFRHWTDVLERSIRGHSSRSELLVVGDLNAKAALWGSRTTDDRGEVVLDMMASLDLHVANVGRTPTFERGNSTSIIDVTLASENLLAAIHDWKVLSGTYCGSDHRYIAFRLGLGRRAMPIPPKPKLLASRIDHLDF